MLRIEFADKRTGAHALFTYTGTPGVYDVPAGHEALVDALVREKVARVLPELDEPVSDAPASQE